MYTSDKEAEKIYSSLTNKNIPEQIRQRFNDVSKKIDDNYPQKDVKEYYEVMNKARDLEALEFAARCLKKMPILTEKFKIMVYLAETVPENYSLFINENRGRISGYVCMAFSLLRTAVKFPKGLMILLTK